MKKAAYFKTLPNDIVEHKTIFELLVMEKHREFIKGRPNLVVKNVQVSNEHADNFMNNEVTFVINYIEQ